jgi:O-antigen ligase
MPDTLTNLKAMIVVLGIALAVFVITKPICLRFMDADDFSRRRNVWFALTLTAFLSPSFWIFAALAVPLLAWSARRDPNPVALYVLLMHVIPPLGKQIPVTVINELFMLDSYRILALAILLPTAWRLVQSSNRVGSGKLTLADILILAYGALHLVLLMPYESVTHTMRRAFLFSVDVLVLYFVVSRTCANRRAIVETMASFCLACAIFAPLALFESLKGWLLYEGIGEQWENAIPFSWLMRADVLRAQVSAGHAIPLGYMTAIAFGFWLYLQSRVHSTQVAIAGMAWMWVGLLAAYSRAPWLVAVVIAFSYLSVGPKSSSRLFKGMLVSALIAGAVLLSPVGDRVIDNLPFVGTVDQDNVSYRQRLAERSWELIQQNPFFGSPFVLLHLEELRQGQGIIDLVNTYATVAMYYGLIGLSLFLGFFVIGIWNAYRLVKATADEDADLSLLGANLIACMIGTLFMLATGSFGTGLEKTFFLLAGLAAAYSQLGHLTETVLTRPYRKSLLSG